MSLFRHSQEEFVYDDANPASFIDNISFEPADSPLKFGELTVWTGSHLVNKVQEVVSRPQFQQYKYGVFVTNLEGKTLCEHNSRSFMIPASNVKIFTAAAALQTLGPEYRHKTPAHGIGFEPPVLEELRISGRGQAAVTTAHLAELAHHLREEGVTRIKSLVLDECPFKNGAVSLSWDFGNEAQDGGSPAKSMVAGPSGAKLTVKPALTAGKPVKFIWGNKTDGRVIVRNQAVTVREADPERPLVAYVDPVAGQLTLRGHLRCTAQAQAVEVALGGPSASLPSTLRETLAAENIAVDKVTLAMGAAAAKITPPRAPWFLDFIMRPLSVLVDRILRWSDNHYAEALLRTLGADHTKRYPAFIPLPFVPVPGATALTAEDRGLRAVHDTVAKTFGVDPTGVILADGSGLSRRNLATPVAIVQALRGIKMHGAHFELFNSCLPVAGVSGTLRTRMHGTIAKGQLRGKTGTLNGVVALSGYVHDLVFAILVNAPRDESMADLRGACDAIATAIAREPLLTADLRLCSWD